MFYFNKFLNIHSILVVDLVAAKIFEHLDCDSLLQLRKVGKRWKASIDNAPVWKTVLDHDVSYK